MTTEQAVRLVEITQRKADELFDELVAELGQAIRLAPEGSGDDVTGTDPIGSAGADKAAWSLDSTAPSGGWEQIESAKGVSYTWPDEVVDRYREFITYRGSGDFAGLVLGLGHLDNGDVVGFVLGSDGGPQRGITYFFPADDFGQTGEKISMIRGGGPRGRSGFGPAEPTPPAYAEFRTDVLRDRKAGKWNVLGVVAEEGDFETMLRHTALQARLRGLV
jgi:hypothetical protein